MILLALSLACLGRALQEAPPERWPEYRGPLCNGDAGDVELPLEWSETKNVRWKTEIPGRGWSTPVAWDGGAWLTTATEDGHDLYVFAVDTATGEILIERHLFEVGEPQHVNALNSHSSPSPVTDGKHVYVHFGAYGTACLEAAGGEVEWERRDLPCAHLEGPGSSPILVGGLLVFHMDGGDEQYVVALDAATGKTVWKVPRDVDYVKTPRDMRKAFGTPLLVEAGGKEQLVSSCARATFAYDPRTGEEIWRLAHDGFSTSSRPITDGERVYLNTGFMIPSLIAVSLGGPEPRDPPVAWRGKKNIPSMSSPVLVDGRLFLVDDGGIASCIDAKSGDSLWRERLDGEFSASPIHAHGRIYFFDTEGTATVVRAGESFEVLAKNQLDDGCMASPIAVSKALLVRTKTHLYRIEE